MVMILNYDFSTGLPPYNQNSKPKIITFRVQPLLPLLLASSEADLEAGDIELWWLVEQAPTGRSSLAGW